MSKKASYFDDLDNRALLLGLFSQGLGIEEAGRRLPVTSRTIHRFLRECEPAYRYYLSTRPEPVVEHGTANGYVHHRCRCEACTRANRERHDEWRNRVRGNAPSHGLNGYVNYACRCRTCKRAGSASNRHYRELRKRRAS